MEGKLVKGALLALVSVGLLVGNANALPFNERDGYVSNFTDYYDEPTLQEILNDFTTGDSSIDAVYDQSNVAIWNQSRDADVDAYRISVYSSNTNKLGIYSYSDPNIYYTFDTLTATGTKANFSITKEGIFTTGDWSDGTYLEIENFGNAFGFYLLSGSTKYYTEDDMNNKISALSYNIDGISWQLPTPSGSGTYTGTGELDDWVLAFNEGSDFDFNDGVYLIEDIEPIPEPATMLLFGTGVAGLFGVARRRRMKN